MIKTIILGTIAIFHGYWIPLVFLFLLLIVKFLFNEKDYSSKLLWALFFGYLLTPFCFDSIMMSSLEAVIDSFITLGLFIVTFFLAEGENDEQ